VVAAGAGPLQPPADPFYGDRVGAVEGPSGHSFWIATHVEDVSEEELVRRASAQGG
jgi:PhnB protein